MMFFGKKDHHTTVQEIKNKQLGSKLLEKVKAMGLNQLIVLNQQHGSEGLLVEELVFNQQPFSLFNYEGDFLITSLSNCGIMILTADCASIIIHDPVRQVVGVVHAGWRGSAAGVLLSAIKKMVNKVGSDRKNLYFIFGPSAQSCCYEVGNDFKQNFANYSYANKAFIKRNNTLYFDNKFFLKLQLKDFGIKDYNIYDQDETCTICDVSYCSFRREKEVAGRQATLVALV